MRHVMIYIFRDGILLVASGEGYEILLKFLQLFCYLELFHNKRLKKKKVATRTTGIGLSSQLRG